MPILYFILSLVSLYLTKTWLTREISKLTHHLGGNRNTTIIFWSLIFLPGTVIHEISHFLVAAATGARTGKIEIMPEFIQDDGGGVALGSVQTQKLNPIQGFLVGVAPFVSGLGLLIWFSQEIQQNFVLGNYWFFSLYLYLFFAIGNSFFPSWSDIRQTLPLIAISISALIIFWIVGISFAFQVSENIIFYLNGFSQVVLISSVLNVFVCLLLLAIKWVLYWIHE